MMICKPAGTFWPRLEAASGCREPRRYSQDTASFSDTSATRPGVGGHVLDVIRY